MGSFYVNYTLRGPTQKQVVDALAGRKSAVSKDAHGCVVVLDEASDDQNTDIISPLAKSLSKQLECPTLAVLNHDDDIFWFQLYDAGNLLDEYNSTPDYFEDEPIDPEAFAKMIEEAQLGVVSNDPRRSPEGGDAEALCRAFVATDPIAVERILRTPQLGETGYVFAVDRHNDLATALRLPPASVGMAFASLEWNELPNGLARADFLLASQVGRNQRSGGPA